MRIGLHDSDNTGFPNLAIMKLSAFHRARGDAVEWWNPMLPYDRVYSSKVFTFTPECEYLPKAVASPKEPRPARLNPSDSKAALLAAAGEPQCGQCVEDVIRGGTGYGLYDALPEEVDSMLPDYTLYPDCDHAIGFLTRGCIRHCPWCVMPRKEGLIRPYRAWREVKRPDSRDIVFMDNNVLACAHGISQIQDMIGQNVRVDFNQGLDARLITPEIAELLSRLKWIRFIRMSCDTDAMLDVVLNAIQRLNRCGVKPYRVFVYLLVQDIASAERRAIALRGAGAEVFAQPYRDFENNIEPTEEQKRFARWVNKKEIFKQVERFHDYDTRKRRKT